MDLSERHHELLAKHHVKMLNVDNMLTAKLTGMKHTVFATKDGPIIQMIFLPVVSI